MKTVARFIALVSLTALSLVAENGVGLAATTTVTIDSTLHPKTLTISAGSTVRWVNNDTERHRMRSRTGPVEFDSNDLEPGDAYSFTFTIAGDYPYLDERDDENAAYFGTIIVADGSGGSGTGGGTGGGGTGGGTAPTAPSTASVRIIDKTFTPGTVTIATGGTVTWSNDDDTSHTVNGSGGMASGTLSGGEKYSRKFTSAGTFNYVCAFHSDMRGTVRVQSASGAVPPAKTSPSAPASGGTTAAAGAAAAAQATKPGQSAVSIVDFAFTPPTVRVRAGDAVMWTNRGQAPHTVTAKDGSFDAGILDPGKTFRRVFADEGSYAYVCQLHPNMTGTVLVGAKAADPATATGSASAQPTAQATSESSAAAVSGSRTDSGATSLSPAGVVGIVIGLPAVLLLGMTVLLRRGEKRTMA